MNEKILKREIRYINEYFREEYELIVKDYCYYIKATERHNMINTSDIEMVCLHTVDYEKAERLFSLIVDNECCVGTINDVIIDQMC